MGRTPRSTFPSSPSAEGPAPPWIAGDDRDEPVDRCDVSVLIVDDDRDASTVIAAILERAGYTVELAGDGLEALALLRKIRPAVIFLDICMPMMDGAEFREAQRHDRDLLSIPTVVMTADRSAEPQLDLAVEETLRKPVRARDLLSIVERHCGKREA